MSLSGMGLLLSFKPVAPEVRLSPELEDIKKVISSKISLEGYSEFSNSTFPEFGN